MVFLSTLVIIHKINHRNSDLFKTCFLKIRYSYWIKRLIEMLWCVFLIFLKNKDDFVINNYFINDVFIFKWTFWQEKLSKYFINVGFLFPQMRGHYRIISNTILLFYSLKSQVNRSIAFAASWINLKKELELVDLMCLRYDLE